MVAIAVGINDRESSERSWINDVSRLRELLQLQRRKLAVLSVPRIDGQPAHLGLATTRFRLNQLLSDYFADFAALFTCRRS